MTTERNDSMGSLLNGVAAARQYGQLVMGLGGTIGARAAYARGGLMARIIDMPAELAMSRGVTVENGGDGVVAEMERLAVGECLSDALRWSLLDGGGAIVVMTQDGGELAQPLDPKRVVMIEELRVVSIENMKAGPNLYTDPTKLNYGWPITYEVRFNSGTNYVPVHESRIVEVPGTSRMAGMDDMSRIPWAGQPVGRAVIDAVDRYRNGVKWAEKLLERSQQAVHRMKGLADMLMAHQEPVVRARIDLVDSNRSALNGVAVDAEDDYTITSASLAGVKDTIGELEVAVAAETGWPVTVLFGRSPGGLNATGDSDWDIVYQQVSQLQRRRIRRPLERLVSLIYAQTGVTIDRPNDWHIVFNPLEVLNEQQTAEMENKKADTLNKVAAAIKTLVVDAAALSQDQATAYLQSERMFGLEPDATGTGSAAAYAGQT
jgi:phage-related protein (TIGR01555 family)